MKSIKNGSSSLSALSDRELWEREYSSIQAIPSSTRQLPSKALLLFAGLLRSEPGGSALDIGCGNGRNAVYLAKIGYSVDALDFSKHAIQATREFARTAQVPDKIRTHLTSFDDGLPFFTEEFELVLDSYVFCHLTEEQDRVKYRSELYRVSKKGGLVYSVVFANDDEYYAAFSRKDSGRLVARDPHNGITKQLYTESEIKKFYSSTFGLRYFVKFQFNDAVLGKSCCRSMFVLLLEK